MSARPLPLGPLGGLAAVPLALLGHGVLAQALIVLALAALLAQPGPEPAGRSAGTARHVPAAMVLLTAGAVAVAQLGAALDLPVLAHGGALRVATASLALVVAAAGFATRVTRMPSERRRGVADPVAVWVPAGAMVAVGCVLAVLPSTTRLAPLLGGDHVRHLVMVSAEQADGFLSYTEQTYPRAWHTVVTVAWAPSGRTDTPDALMSLLETLAAATWLSYAAMVLALCAVGRAMAERWALGRASTLAATVCAGAFALWPTFLQSTVLYGFETVPLAVVALVAPALALLRDRPPRRSDVVIAGAALAVVAHTWQLMLPASALLLVAVVRSACRGRESAVPGPGRAAGVARRLLRVGPVLVLAVPGLVVALPSLVAVVVGVGVAHGSEAGSIFPTPWLWASAVGAAAGVAVVRRSTGPGVRAYGAAVLLTVASGPGLAVALGIAMSSYYPVKLMWFGIIVGLPLLSTAVALLAEELASRSTRIRPLAGAVAGTMVATVVVAGLLGTVPPLLGRWRVVDPAVVLAAVTTPGAARADVVWLGRDGSVDHSEKIARTMLDHYRVAQTRDRVEQENVGRPEECALLRSGDDPVVLSDQPADQVRSRYACAPDLRVLPVGSG